MASLRRLVWQYYAYRLTTSIGFYLPVGVVFLTEARGFDLEAVGTIMAAYLVGMLVAEIPTGYVGDRVGRRASLAIGNAMGASAMLAWAFLETPMQYVLLNVFWATGTAFRSGTAGAFLYELLDASGAASEYARISGRAATIRLAASAAGAVTAGALVAFDWSYPFLANAALSAAGIPILATFPSIRNATSDDSDSETQPNEPTFSVRDAVRMLHVQAKRPEVRWFVAYAATVYGVFQLGMAFEQPALRAVGVPLTALGVLYAGFELVSAGAASTTGWLNDRLGIRSVFGLAAPIIGVIFAVVAACPIAIVPALFATRALNAITAPLRNQYLNDRLGNVGRATALSGASMVLSVTAAVFDVLGGIIAETTGPVRFLAGAGIAAAGVAGLLWFTVSPVRDPVDEADEDGSLPAVSD